MRANFIGSHFFMKNFKHYLITDPKYYTNDPDTFARILTENLKKHKVDFACFRDKSSDNTEELAAIFVQICSKFEIFKVLINSDIDLALKLKANGVHLTSQQFDKIEAAKKNNLFVIISCHTKEEIEEAKRLGANMVTYSPIFSTPNKGEAKGIEDLKEVVENSDMDIIALGGIVTKSQVLKVKKSKAAGFAAIRYFVSL